MSGHIIGVTGGIGAGKTTVARMLGELGAYVLDADEISRQALAIGSPCYQAVLDWLGNAILGADGAIDRRALADLVFADAQKRERLNAIIHPHVLQVLEERTKNIAEQDKAPCVVWDVPLLFESGYHKHVGYTVLVTAPAELRLKRLSMPREEAQSRMRAQWTDGEKAPLADCVLPNGDTLAELRQAVQSLYQDWRACHPERREGSKMASIEDSSLRSE